MSKLFLVILSCLAFACTNPDEGDTTSDAPEPSAAYVAANPHCVDLCADVESCAIASIAWMCDPAQCLDANIVCVFDGAIDCAEGNKQQTAADIVVGVMATATAEQCLLIQQQLWMAGIE
jgi:hypothetical protein